jgi:hypothetical protein
VNNIGSASPLQRGPQAYGIHAPEVMLCAVDERYGHLIGVAAPQFRVAVDIEHRVALAGLGTDGSYLCYRLITQMTALPRQDNDPLTARTSRRE